MLVKEIMKKDPQCALPDADLIQVAQMMRECDCGAIPIIDDPVRKRPVGIITDRDIAIRAVAEGMNPSRAKAREYMSQPLVCINPEASLEECARIMEDKQLRRLVVVDANGKCCGIVVQGQVAIHAPRDLAGEMLQDISQPSTLIAG